MQSIFNKAVETKIYSKFYSELCQKLVHLELCLLQKEIKASTLKLSYFSQSLVNHCKDQFILYLNPQPFQDQEQEVKHRSRFLCLLKFFGELNLKGLLSNRVICLIFKDLFNRKEELHVEGACILINQIGYSIEDKAEKALKSKKQSRASGLNQTLQELMSVFFIFESLLKDKSISVRNQKLIKNMLEYREGGWEKARSEKDKGPMKLEELKAQMNKENEGTSEEEERRRKAPQRGVLKEVNKWLQS